MRQSTVTTMVTTPKMPIEFHSWLCH